MSKYQKQSHTSYLITTSLKYMENEILKESGLSQTAFLRKAIDHFVEGDHKIDERFRITKRTDPNYIKKSYREQIYIEEERLNRLKEIAKEQNCGITIVLFQLLYEYCLLNSSILQEYVLVNLINETYTIED